MRIGIDARMINSSGIGTYIKGLIQGLSQFKDHEYILYGRLTELSEYTSFEKKEINCSNYSLAEQISLPLKLSKGKMDILHAPHYPAPIFYPGKIVVTIHDLIHLLFPEYLPSKSAYLYAKVIFNLVCKRAKRIIAVSNNSKEDIERLLGIDKNKIKVIYEGVNQLYKPVNDGELLAGIKKKYGIDEGFILFVGNLKPHKNISRLIQAFLVLKKTYKIPHKLVIIGEKKSGYKEISKLLTNDIIVTGIIPKEDLLLLYNVADVFVFPSLYEGFGLPPLEAMACGTPVITSNVSSLPEVVGEAGIMVNPNSIEGLASAIYKVISDKELKNSLIKKGFEQVKRFSWTRCALETLKVYQEAYLE